MSEDQRFEAQANELGDDFRVWDHDRQQIAVTGYKTKADAAAAADRMNARAFGG